MRFVHKAGEKLFVDYAGPTMEVVSAKTGEVKSVQVFVASQGASNYTFAEATWTQGCNYSIHSHLQLSSSEQHVTHVHHLHRILLYKLLYNQILLSCFQQARKLILILPVLVPIPGHQWPRYLL